MKHKSKRILALILALAMMMSLMVVGVAAQDVEDDTEDAAVTETTDAEEEARFDIDTVEAVSNYEKTEVPDVNAEIGGVTAGADADSAGLEAVDGEDCDGAVVGNGVIVEQVDRSEVDVDLTRYAISDEGDIASDYALEDLEPIDYAQDEVLRVMIVLEGDSVVESDPDADVLSTYAANKMSALDREQAAVITAIEKEVLDGEELDVEYQFNWVINAISAEVPYGTIDEIEELDNVEAVYIEEMYYPAETSETDSGDYDLLLSSSGTMIGREEAWAAGYDGSGMKVAVIDTGLDTSHVNFQGLPDDALRDSSADEEFVTSVLPYLNSYEVYGSNLTAARLYYNTKVPYGFNYIDENLVVNHDSDSQGDHGTHVSGIIAANDVNDVKGVAYNAQLYVMKVFGAAGGAYDSDLIAAIEDAMMLDADAINMSLGSTAGFTYDDNEVLNRVYAAVAETDVILAIAAGNEYTLGFYNLYGYNAMRTDNPDNGVVSAPATYPSALSVASVENAGLNSYYVEVDGQKMGYTEGAYGSNKGMDILFDTTQEYVMVPGWGVESDYEGLDVSGKVAVVSRGGGVTFAEKHETAEAKGAIAVLVYNNESGTANASLEESSGTIPFATMSRADGAVLQAAYDAALEAGEAAEIYFSDHMELMTNSSGYEMNTFSSWGVTADLRLEPDITAPGGEIYSTTNHDTYDIYSGTSMATPQVAGMSALVKQYLTENYPGMADTEYRAMLTELLMSTASPLYYDDGETYYSPREQGNGLANVYDAITSTAYLQVADTIEPQIELGDDADKTGSYTYSFDVVNFGDTDLYYDITTTIQTEDCDYGDDGYLYMASAPINLDGTTSASGSAVIMTYDYDENAAANSHDAWLLYQKAGEAVDWSVEPVFRYDLTGDDGVTTSDAQAYLDTLTGLNGDVNLSAQVVEVKAGATETVTISVRVADSGKAWMDAYYPNGIYVEGFTMLTAKNGGVDLSIPYLAFYGDWSVAPMLDGGYYWMEDDELDEKTSQYYNVIYTNYGSSDYGFLPGVNPYIDEVYEPENNSLSPNGDGYVDAITDIYVTLLRGAKTLTFTFEDEETGELYNEVTIENARKAFYYSGYGVCTPNFYAWYGDPWYGTDADGNTLPDGTKVKLTIHADLDWADYDSSVNLSDTWVETITIDTKAPEVKLDDEETMPSIEYIYDDEGNIVQQLLTLTYRDDVNVSAVNFVTRGMFILSQYLVDHSAKDEDGWITETYDVTGLGNSFYLVLGDYAINESTYHFTTIDNNPVLDTDLMYGFRVSDEEYYNDYVYGWVSVDPTTGESAVLDSEYYIDYSITAATYVNGYVFAAAADHQLYTIIPGLWDEWIWVGDLGYELRTMTYDPANECLWGFTSSGTYRMLKIDLEDLAITDLGWTEATWTAIASDDSGNLYGINTNGVLCLIDQKTGEAASEIRDLSKDIASYLDVTSGSPSFVYSQSMTYNAEDGCFYWAAYTSNYTRFGGLVRIQIAESGRSASVEIMDSIQGNSQIVGLWKLEDRGGFTIPEEGEYEITDIYLQEETVTMLAGNSVALNYLVTPWYADRTTLIWSSSNTSVATVSNEGEVTSISEGSATITVTDPTGTVSAVCTVEVVKPDATLYGYANYFYSYTIDQQWFSFSASDVANYDVLSDYLIWYLLAAEYADGYIYGYDYTGEFVRMDPANNYETVLIGTLPITPTPGTEPYRNRMYAYDMAYDWSTGTMYALISCYNAETDASPLFLYTVDLLTGDLERVCELTDEHSGMAACITIDDNSVLYMITGNAILSTYDLKTGETHDIGMTGVTPNGGFLSMTYDHETGYIYWADSYGIYFVDKESGNAYRLGRLEGSHMADVVGLYVVNDEEYLPEREDVAVSSVSVDSDKVLLMEGTSSALPLTIHPINASDRNLNWTIADDSIAVIKDGYVYGLKAGTTTAVGTIATSGGTVTVNLTIEVAPADEVVAWAYQDLWYGEAGWTSFAANDLSTAKTETAQYNYILAGTYYDGKIYAYGGSTELMIIDADSWKVEQEIPWEEPWELCDITFDYTTGTFYGVTTAAGGYNTSENPGALYMIDFETGEAYKIADYNSTIWCLACSADGTLYGYHSDGSLVTIDKLTGAQTVVGYTGYLVNQPGTMAFDYNTGNLFISATYYEYTSYDQRTSADLLLVDPTDATTFRLGQLGLCGVVLSMLYTVPTTFDDTVPADYTPTGIWLSSTKENLQEGETVQLSAAVAPISITGKYANETITFSSSDSSVATVTQDGLVTAVSGGKTTITASWKNLSASCSVQVLDEDSYTLYVMSPDSYETASLINPDNKNSAVSYPSALPTLQDTVYSSADDLFYGMDESGYLWKYSLDGSTVERLGTKDALRTSYEILLDYEDPDNPYQEYFLDYADPDGTAVLTDMTYNTFDDHVYMMIEVFWDQPGYWYQWNSYFIFRIDSATGELTLCGEAHDMITTDVPVSFTFVEEDYIYCYCGYSWIFGQKLTLDYGYNGSISNVSLVGYDYDVFQDSQATKADMVYVEDLDAVYMIGYDTAHRTGLGIYKFDMHTAHLTFEGKASFSTDYISLVIM